MKNKIVLFLLATFLCANTSIGQLLKVPNLFEHYKEHKNEDVTSSSISFIQFLEQHYSKNPEHNHDEHHDLPFKTFDNVQSVLFTVSYNNFQIQVLKPLITSKKKFFYSNSFKSNLITSIWLPPKIG